MAAAAQVRGRRRFRAQTRGLNGIAYGVGAGYESACVAAADGGRGGSARPIAIVGSPTVGLAGTRAFVLPGFTSSRLVLRPTQKAPDKSAVADGR